MKVNEYIKKGVLYFNPNETYFEFSRSDCKIDDYGIEFEKFIDNSIIYNLQDDNFIPYKLKNGRRYYFISLIISYGLAHLQRYLREKDESSLVRLKNSVYFLVNNCYESNNCIFLRSFFDDQREVFGECSAMDNGMAISLISRFYLVNKDPELSEFCSKLLQAYYVKVEEGGFTREVSEHNYWFDEFPNSNHRVLNGKIFAIIGLIDYKKIIDDKVEVRELIEYGVNGLVYYMKYFDKGWWSNYFFGTYSYIASAKYHSLHVLQLAILADELENKFLSIYSKKFRKYDNSLNRFISGFVLIIDKVKMKILK